MWWDYAGFDFGIFRYQRREDFAIGLFTTLIYSGVVLVSGYKFVYGEEGL